MAGVFHSQYVTEDDDVESAITSIYEQAHSDEVKDALTLHGIDSTEVKMGLVVQKLIEPDVSGVIYTDVNGHNLLVQYTEGFGEQLVDGETYGSAILMDSVGNVQESANFEANPIERKARTRLAELTQKINALFDYVPQDIEFAFRDNEAYILQARTLTADLGRVDLDQTAEDTLTQVKEKLRRLAAREKKELQTDKVVFSDSNFAELLPTPTEMDFGIFSYIFTGSDGVPGGIQLGRQQMGYPLGDESVGYMQYIGGKPYFSIARDAGTFYAGFPESRSEYFTTLVQEYLDKIQEDPSRGSYPEMGLYLQDPTVDDLRERFGDRAEEYYATYRQFSVRMAEHAASFQTKFQNEEYPHMTQFVDSMKKIPLSSMSKAGLAQYSLQVLEHLRTVSCVNFVKSARLGFYYSQRLQQELRTTCGLSEEEAEQTFAKLSQGLSGSAITETNISLAQASTFTEAMQLAPDLVGHYSTGEMLQVRHPRMKDDPSALAYYVQGIRQSGTYVQDFERQKKERAEVETQLLDGLPRQQRESMEKIMRSSQTYMALRESIKYQFAREYDLIHDSLDFLGTQLELTPGDIYYVYPRELPQLVDQPNEFQHRIEARKKAFEHYASFGLPSVLREEDIDNIQTKGDSTDEFTEAHGSFLAGGEAVLGTVVNLDELEDPEEIRKIISGYKELAIPIILVAKQMNLSHDPFIMAAAGLILEKAVLVSHGAQRARELGRGAIGGLKAALLKTGTTIEFDPTKKIVKKVTDKSKQK